jgi:hypothetical protein
MTRQPSTSALALRRYRAILICAALLTHVGWAGAEPPSAAPVTQPQGDSRPLFSLATGLGPLEYVPGRGLRVGDTGLSLGGYTSLNVERPDGGPGDAALDELSLFIVWNPVPRLHLFSELEGEDLLHVDDQGRSGTGQADFILERLYGNFALSDRFNLRLGQFLTPVGRWNLIHAQPLVWTTSRPLSTLLAFDTHTTGGMVYGTVVPQQPALTYAVYGQFFDSLDRPRDDTPKQSRSAGLRLDYALRSQISVGGSYVTWRDHGEWDHVIGIDADWHNPHLELLSEAVVTAPEGSRSQQWGLYVQAAVPLGGNIYLIGRYEHFAQRAPQPEINLLVPAFAYRPVPYAVFKLEYLFAGQFTTTSPPGLHSAFALLF